MSTPKLKYYTNTKDDFLNAEKTYNHFRGTFKLTKAPHTNFMDTTLTDCNIRKPIGQLPYHSGTPYMGKMSYGDPTIESSLLMSGLSSTDKKKTFTPIVEAYYNKSFYIFEKSIVDVPDATKSVETKDKGFSNGRMGISTRFL